MKKYNLSQIMKKAWSLVKGFGMTMSSGLKQAWAEAKSYKAHFIAKLDAIVAEANSHDNGYHYEMVLNNWENYGRSRTYFAVYETRDNSRHNKKFDYGYFDNETQKYFPTKYNNLEKNYTISGRVM